jgi:hypothetical protein
MYVCVLPLTNTQLFLYILSIFPFFTPFCNRQMKVKKKRMHWIHTSFQGRWGQASPRIVDDILLLLPFSLSICLSFSLFLLSLHDSTLASCIVCPNSSNSRFSSVYYYIISSLFLYITPNIYNTTFVLSRFSFFFLPLFFSKKKTNTDWLLFFCGTFFYACMFLCFDCCCCSYSFLVPITICMCVCMKRKTRRET